MIKKSQIGMNPSADGWLLASRIFDSMRTLKDNLYTQNGPDFIRHIYVICNKNKKTLKYK